MIPRAIAGAVFCLAINLNSFGYSKRLPDFIHPCDTLKSECLIERTNQAIPEFVKGLPELGLETIDPFVVEELTIPLQGMNVTFHKGKVTGFHTCIADDVFSNLEKRKFKLAFHCNITLNGLYEAKGKLLLFPIDGAGKAKVELTNLRMNIDMNTKYIKDDKGLVYFGIRNYKYNFEYGDKVTFDLENIFKESKELSQTVLTFLNENWKTVAEEFGKPIVDYAVELAFKVILKFFEAVPVEELVHVPLPSPLPGHE